MNQLKLSSTGRAINDQLRLSGSKSISNRALIIRALTDTPFEIAALARAKDTVLMQSLLQSNEKVRDAGPAGTTFRFLTAYLSLQEGEQLLTGTERMKQRPIGVLVDALRALGANIEYVEKEGYPPLSIGAPSATIKTNKLQIPASTSSQYISALLMIAPILPEGLELTLVGKVVSRPYIEMTLNLMAYFGVQHIWEDDKITVVPQAYTGKPFTVEADWSAASYYYAIAAISEECDLQLDGLFEESVQGDAVLKVMMEHFGITTTFNSTGARLQKKNITLPTVFEWDFLTCPDLAQTLAVICGATGVTGRFSGLETLKIKETDRIVALQQELNKVGVSFTQEAGTEIYRVEGKAKVLDLPVFETYEDHRMAMAFAPLAVLGDIIIEDPAVVGKSYPDYWTDLESIGFQSTPLE